MDRIAMLSSKKAVVIFSKSSCCMCHAIKRLFYEQGVIPMIIHDLDEDSRVKEMELVLKNLGCSPSVPAVFIGGRLVGSASTVFTLQLDGSFNKMLKDAGALWL